MVLSGQLQSALAGAGLTLWLRHLPEPPRRSVVRFDIQLPRDAEAVGATGSTIAFSPNGSQVVYVGKAQSGQRLYSRRMDRPDPTPIPGSEGGSTRFTEGNNSFPGMLYSIPADGSGAPQPIMEQAGQWKATGFEPGSRGIVFSGRATPQGKEEIWRTDITPGAKATQILASPFDNGSPSLSPDGRWLAYSANESGRNEVYVRPYPGPGGRWQVSLDGGTEPIWSPRGGEIFYRNGDAMMAAAVRTQPGFEVTGRTKLFTGQYGSAGFRDHNYSVAPDGKTFVMLQAVVGAQQALVVTLNWFDQFRSPQR